MAKKTSKKAAKKAAPKAAKKSPKRAGAAPESKALSKKLDQLRTKFLSPKAVRAPAGKKLASASDATVAAVKSAREVVEAAMPGVRVLGAPSATKSDAPLLATSQGAGLDSLRKKYGVSGPAAASDTLSVPGNSVPGKSEVVMVDSSMAASDDRGPGPKAIIVSRGQIVGRQG